MTRLLEKAFARAARLPDEEQNALARWLLEELESERKWEQSFAGSQDLLAQLAEEADREHRQGKTRPLDPDKILPRVSTLG